MKIIVFDVDETLGAFFEFSQFCNSVVYNKRLSYPMFRYLLDSNPKFLQPNIVNVLKYIRHYKGKNCKVVMFTNNQGHPIWIQYIKLYLHEKLNYELFDKIVYAKKYEPKRKEESKCLNDFWSCTQYPPNSKVLFLFPDFPRSPKRPPPLSANSLDFFLVSGSINIFSPVTGSTFAQLTKNNIIKKCEKNFKYLVFKII